MKTQAILVLTSLSEYTDVCRLAGTETFVLALICYRVERFTSKENREEEKESGKGGD